MRRDYDKRNMANSKDECPRKMTRELFLLFLKTFSKLEIVFQKVGPSSGKNFLLKGIIQGEEGGEKYGE